MGRGIPSDIKTALNAATIAGLFYLVKIELQSGTTIYVAEREITYDENDYLAVLKRIDRIPYVLGQNEQLQMLFSNVDQYFTLLDLQESFLAAKVTIYEYLDALETAHVKWIGWADNLTDITLVEAKLGVYAGASSQHVDIPKRSIEVNCPWVFGRTWEGISTTNYEGSECPYQKYTTIGFTTTLASDIDDEADPIVFDVNALPGSQYFGLDDELLIDSEVLRVSSVDGNELTCSRAMRGTTIAAHSTDATVKFYDCHYTSAACKRRGMYGNNSSDGNKNYFGGFPLASFHTKQSGASPRGYTTEGSLVFVGDPSAYGKIIPLIYGRNLLTDLPVPVASEIGVASNEEDWEGIVIIVGEGLLATNADDATQTTPVNAYATGKDGLENILVNGKHRHNAGAGGPDMSNGWFGASAPEIWNIDDFELDNLGFLGCAWVCLTIREKNNADSLDPSVDGCVAEAEVRYGRCVRVYTTPSAYTFKATTDGADVLLDVETSKKAGPGLEYSKFNIQSFIDVKTYNQGSVTSVVSGESVPRWTFNGVIADRKPMADYEKAICLGMFCTLPFLDVNGLYKIRSLKTESTSGVPVFSSTSGTSRNILVDDSGMSTLRKTRKQLLDLPNEIRISFVEKKLAPSGEATPRYPYYQYTQTEVVLSDREAQYLLGKVTGSDARRIVSKSYNIIGCSSVDEAARLGTLILRAGEFAEGGTQNNLVVEFDTLYKTSNDIELGDIIKVEDAVLNSVSEAYFRVIEMTDESTDVEGGGFIFRRHIKASLHSNTMYDDTAFTCTDITRLPNIPSQKSEPPAVTNFNVAETGVVNKFGENKSALLVTYIEPGEYVGNINHTGGYSEGATSIAIDGITDSTLMLDKLDRVYIDGHTTVYRVTTAINCVDGAVTLTLDTGLQHDVTDNQVVHVYVRSERQNFRNVVLMKSSTTSDGLTVGDWSFVAEIMKSGTVILYDISNQLEVFSAVSKSLNGFVPSVETKNPDDEFKYPRDTIMIDGTADGANPYGATDLLIITNHEDPSIPVGFFVAQFKRDTANYTSIFEEHVVVTKTLQASGPYSDQRSGRPLNIVDSGVVDVVAGQTFLPITILERYMSGYPSLWYYVGEDAGSVATSRFFYARISFTMSDGKETIKDGYHSFFVPALQRVRAFWKGYTYSISGTETAGPSGGTIFQDIIAEGVPTGAVLRAIKIWAGSVVDAIQASWVLSDGTTQLGTKHGGSGGSLTTITLDADEYLTGIDGYYDTWIQSLTFITNKGSYGPYGTASGTPFSIDIPQDETGNITNAAVGFHGQYDGGFIKRIGLTYAACSYAAAESAPSGATGWNLYIGETLSTLRKINAEPISLEVQELEPTTGWVYGFLYDKSGVNRYLCIWTDDESDDSDLDWQKIISEDLTGIQLAQGFNKGGTFNYAIVTDFALENISAYDNVLYQIIPIANITSDKNTLTWRTPLIPCPNGKYYASVYSKNPFGGGTKLDSSQFTIGLVEEDLTDDAPPAMWSVIVTDPDPSDLHYGDPAYGYPNQCVIVATRPALNGINIKQMLAQLKDVSTGSWRALDANTGASVLKYDGSATNHTFDPATGILTKATGGWGTAAAGDLLLMDVDGESFGGINNCLWYGIDDDIQILDDFTLYVGVTRHQLAIRQTLTGAVYENMRIKIVAAPHDWETEGYQGGLGVGLDLLELWDYPDKQTGLVTFRSGCLPIPAGKTLSDLGARVWFTNNFSVSDDSEYGVYVAPNRGGAILEVLLEMMDGAEQSSSSSQADRKRAMIRFDPAYYDGDPIYYFEVIAGNNNATTAYDIELVDSSDTVIATCNLPAETADDTRIRSSAISAGLAAGTYRVRLPQTASSGNVQIIVARIVVNQFGATKTRLQLSLVGHRVPGNNDALYVVGSTTYTNGSENGAIALYRKAFEMFKNLASVSFEASFAKYVSGTAYVALFNKTKDAMVTGSELSNATETFDVKYATVALDAANFDEGDIFEIRVKTGSSGAINLGNCYLYLVINPITKVYNRKRLGKNANNGGTINFGRAICNNLVTFEVVATDSGGTDIYNLHDVGSSDTATSGTTITGATLSPTVSSSKSITTKSQLVCPSGHRYVAKCTGSPASYNPIQTCIYEEIVPVDAVTLAVLASLR